MVREIRCTRQAEKRCLIWPWSCCNRTWSFNVASITACHCTHELEQKQILSSVVTQGSLLMSRAGHCVLIHICLCDCGTVRRMFTVGSVKTFYYISSLGNFLPHLQAFGLMMTLLEVRVCYPLIMELIGSSKLLAFPPFFLSHTKKSLYAAVPILS
jgi:hypothetical protein